MKMIHNVLLYLHIIVGAVMLVVFWMPVFAKKGSAFHVKAGRLFTRGMYVVALCGIALCLLSLFDPMAIRIGDKSLGPEKIAKIIDYSNMMSLFLLMLSLLVLLTVKHATLVLKAKSNKKILQQWHHVGLALVLGLVSLVVGFYGIVNSQTLLIIFAVISVLNSIATLRYCYRPTVKQREWVIEHFSSIIGAGIGVYTAFFAFGGRAYFSELLTGVWQILPWVLPAIVGLALEFGFKKVYQVRYRVG